MATPKITKKEMTRLRKLFKRDMATLEANYKLSEIAEKSGIDLANLSSYKSDKPGTKQPGIKILKKFYAAFDGELENPFNKTHIMEDKKINEDQQDDPKRQKKADGPDSNSGYNLDDDPPTLTNEPGVTIPLYNEDVSGLKKELLAAYKTDNAHLRTVNNKLLDNGDKILGLPHKYLDSIDKIVATHSSMTETHQKIIDSLLRKMGD